MELVKFAKNIFFLIYVLVVRKITFSIKWQDHYFSFTVQTFPVVSG